MAINKYELIEQSQLLLCKLVNTEPKQESIEWYLINNLKQYLEILSNAETAMEIKKATEKLDMCCIESMDWNTPLFKRCAKITELVLKVEKNS
jgi:hypothetical protein